MYQYSYPTGNLSPGDVINDPIGGRKIEVEEAVPVVIPYYDEMVEVWRIKGRDTRPTLKQRTVVITCVPRHRWEIALRRGDVAGSAM